MDTILFQEACDKIINIDRNRNGIGTLGEKTIHAVLKYYFEPNEEYHEIKENRFVADIATEDGIIEIQTGNFNLLRRKLESFLKEKKVTIVYPIPYVKWLKWIDETTGEVGKKRKSPKKGTPYRIFPELYKIKEYLKHPNLELCMILINMEEYRLLNGWSYDKKRGSSRYDRIPLELVDEVYVRNPGEYQKLIPEGLEEEFISKEYQRAAGLSLSAAQKALNVLHYVGAVERSGKRGNAYIYKRSSFEKNRESK